ncbi:MAG: ABC transporter permease [Actinomycetota bacterium]|nr:ABC transporter permease [Actinomycetota bacterium]
MTFLERTTMSVTYEAGDFSTSRASNYRYSWDLVTHLVGREFRLRYRRTIFGWLWAMGYPLARLLVLAFLFTRILPLGIENYAVFAFTGIIAWSWFATGIASATSSVIDRRDLLIRPGVPRSVVPIVSVLTDGLDYAAALPVLAVFLLLGDGIPLTSLLLPVILVVQLLFTLGFGLALCAANVYLRDVRLLVDVVMLLGFYLTPVFYDAQSVPDRYRLVLDLNPMAHLLSAYRDILIAGHAPATVPFLVLTTVGMAILAVGYLIYRWASPSFVDEL